MNKYNCIKFQPHYPQYPIQVFESVSAQYSIPDSSIPGQIPLNLRTQQGKVWDMSQG